jgi:hypothetical protein
MAGLPRAGRSLDLACGDGGFAPGAAGGAGTELRVVAPDGTIIHDRAFLPDRFRSTEDMHVLRKRDGTGIALVRPQADPLSPGDRRLRLSYRRDNRARAPESAVFSQAGDQSDETVVLDIPWSTVVILPPRA